MPLNTTIFLGIFIIAILLFTWSCYQRFRLVALGRPDNRLSQVGKRALTMLFRPLSQQCSITRRYPFGINHAVLFWCFMVLLIANAEFLLHGLVPGIGLSHLPTGLYYTLAFFFDLVSLLALLAVSLAVIRRLVFPPKYIAARSRDAFIILGLVATLMIAFFGLRGSQIAAGTEEAARYMPVSSVTASILAGIPAENLPAFENVFWWIHALVLLGFMNYLPYSKHMHILTAAPNLFFRSITAVNTQPGEEFNIRSSYGVGQVDSFTWKGLFDSYACTECGRCSDNCPAASTDKPLNPRLVLHDIKINLLTNGPRLLRKDKPVLPLIGGGGEGSIAEEALWGCTTCGACMEICPIFAEHIPRIVEMRRYMVEMKAKFPQELLALFENMEQRSNPWGIAPGDRAKWAAESNVRLFEAGKTEYLFYVGCSGSFDARSRQVTLSVAKILDAAGISWGILGKDEKCCGDSLRRLGNEFVFDRMAKENVKLFRDKGVKKIIVQCPHCFSTLKNDYRQYGIELEVIHHSELINDLIQQKKLNFNGTTDLGNVVFHDSCYLGRHNDVYIAPREAIASVTGQAPVEMKRNFDKSFCCGAGGGRMWMEENLGKRINVERVEEALAEDAKTVCVCCPYCMTMFEDGLKDKDAEDKIKVLDLAEIVAGAIK